MTRRFTISLLFACAMSAVPMSRAEAQLNCPVIADQVINVEVGHKTLFHLTVQHTENSTISIVQYPLGGALQPVGPTPLDFVFVPGEEFNGFSSFRYQIQPPFGCPESKTIGTVSLMGGQAAGTTTGIVVDPPASVSPALVGPLGALCGLGLMPLFLCAGVTWLIVLFPRRRS